MGKVQEENANEVNESDHQVKVEIELTQSGEQEHVNCCNNKLYVSLLPVHVFLFYKNVVSKNVSFQEPKN